MFSAGRRRCSRRDHTWSAIAIAVSASVLSLVAAACSPSGTAPDSATAADPAIDPIIRIDPPVAIADFELMSSRGQPYLFSEGDGELRLFYFGYTNCPDICPATMVDWRNARRSLGERAEVVRFLMVTVDPENDTPEALGEYLSHFDPTFVGLSGTDSELRQAWDAFDVEVQRLELPESATQHSISHSASVFVVDADEQLVMKLAFDATDEDIVKGILQLLDESSTEGRKS